MIILRQEGKKAGSDVRGVYGDRGRTAHGTCKRAPEMATTKSSVNDSPSAVDRTMQTVFFLQASFKGAREKRHERYTSHSHIEDKKL